MAPPRRAASSARDKSQSTLSFRATKAGAHAAPVGKADATATAASPPLKKPRLSEVKAASELNDDEQPKIEREDAEEVEQTEEAVMPPQARSALHNVNPSLEAIKAEEKASKEVTVNQEDSEEEADEQDEELTARYAAAHKMSAAAIKRYWVEKEASRRAPRVHQKSLSMHEKLLREWDVASRWGPSVGVGREARWRRAHELGLGPPVEVLAVLVQSAAASAASETHQSLQVSIVDELLASSGREGMAAQA